MYLSDYTTPDAVIRQLDKADASVSPIAAQAEYTDFFNLIVPYCRQASSYITNYTGDAYVPYKEPRSYYMRDLALDRRMSRGRLFLDAPLLVVSSITWNNTLLSATQWRVPNDLPYRAIVFDSGLGWSGDFNADIEIVGTWGVHNQLSTMYTVVEVITGSLTISGTSIVVANASAYELLSYLRISGELLHVTAKNTFTNTLTVTRGVNGTTAAAYTTTYTIERYNVLPDIALAATRLASFMYQRRSDATGRTQYGDGSTVLADLPMMVKETLDKYVSIGGSAA